MPCLRRWKNSETYSTSCWSNDLSSPWQFLTVADELLVYAAAAADYFTNLGYKVTPEKHELGYPFAPTLHCKRQSTTCFVEVDEAPPVERLNEWVAFGRSLRGDTRVLLVIPDHVDLGAKASMTLKRLGVGIMIASKTEVAEAIPAQDLALQVELPDISKEPARVKTALGPVYEQFERNQWREGFEEACLAFETAARAYLWKTLDTGRTNVLKKNGTIKPLTKTRVMSMTMGALAHDFANLQQQNHADSVIGATLKLVNKDRIRVAHKKRTAAAERALRLNVGQQMWRLVGAMKEIYKP